MSKIDTKINDLGHMARQVKGHYLPNPVKFAGHYQILDGENNIKFSKSYTYVGTTDLQDQNGIPFENQKAGTMTAIESFTGANGDEYMHNATIQARHNDMHAHSTYTNTETGHEYGTGANPQNGGYIKYKSNANNTYWDFHVNEDGHHISGLKSYATEADAIADAALPSGALFKVDGETEVRIK